MTWEQFEQSGAVEDYLLYKSFEAAKKHTAFVSRKAKGWSDGVTEHGTDDNGDRHGAGRTSIR